MRGAACLLICLLAGQTWAEDWAYTLRPGDDIWSIARQFCGSGNRAAAIARHNNVANPTQIKAGQRINIPVAWLVFAPSAARIIAVTDDVAVQRATAGLQNNSRQRARVGDELNMGDRVITAEGSAEVEFADQSTLSIAPQSHVLFNKLTEFGPAGMVDTHLRFAYGRGKARVQPQNRGDRFRIQTPEGVAAVRGTEFRVGHSADAALAVTHTETLEGLVDFAHHTTNTPVPAGFGLAASSTGLVKEALLPAPQWLDTDTLSHPEARLGWRAVPGADRYMVTWYAQSQPRIVFSEYVSHDTALNIDVPRGDYRLSVRAVSAAGIEGFDSVRALQVRSLAPTLQPLATEVSGNVAFSWQFPHLPQTFTLTILDTDGTLVTRLQTPEQTALVNLPAGSYTWQVAAAASAPSQPQAFALRPPVPQGLAVTAQQRRVTVTWLPQQDIDEYIVALQPLSSSAGPQAATQPEQFNVRVQDSRYTFEAPAFGRYRVTVTAMQAGVASRPAGTDVSLQRRPWWLLLVPLLTL